MPEGVRRKASGDTETGRQGEGGFDVQGSRFDVQTQCRTDYGPQDHGQGSEVRGRRSATDEERGRVVDHGTQHPADFRTCPGERLMLRSTDVAAVLCKVQRGVRFPILAIAVRQFADEMGFVAAFSPRLSEIETHRTGGSPSGPEASGPAAGSGL